MLRSSSRSCSMNLELEKHRQGIRQLIILKSDEEGNEETRLTFKKRWHMRRALHQTPKVTITFIVSRQQP